MPIPTRSFLHAGMPPAALLVLALAGCAPGGPRPDVPPPVDPVAEHVATGDLRAAAESYERLAREERKLREHYQLLAARTWRDEGAFDELARVLSSIRLKRLTPPQRLEFDLLSAERAVAAQAWEEALALLVLPDLPESERARQLELRARAESGLGKAFEAARTRLELGRLLAGPDRDANRDEMVSELGKLPAATLVAELGRLPADAPMRAYIEVMLQRQKIIPPRVALPLRDRVDTTPGQVTPAFRPAQKIALLVPTRGEFAAAGEVIRDGFLAAHFSRKDAARVQVFDTGASRKSALAAFQQAIDAGFSHFVGPLERDQVEAVLAARQPHHQFLTLNQPLPGSLVGIDSYRFALAPENDGAAASEAMVGAGLKRFVVVGTEEEWSARAVEGFRAQAEAMGGTIQLQARIRSGAIDFAEALAPLATVFRPAPPPLPAADRGAAVADPAAPAPETVAPHDFGVDGVFVAVRPADARLLVPQLRVRGLDVLPIVAAPQVFTGANAMVDGDLNGVSFLDGPWPHNLGAMQPSRLELGEHLSSALQSPRLFAFGLDAYLLFPYREHLRTHPGSHLEGANGVLQVDPQGRVRRGLSWFRFEDGLPTSRELLPARP